MSIYFGINDAPLKRGCTNRRGSIDFSLCKTCPYSAPGLECCFFTFAYLRIAQIQSVIEGHGIEVPLKNFLDSYVQENGKGIIPAAKVGELVDMVEKAMNFSNCDQWTTGFLKSLHAVASKALDLNEAIEISA